MIFFSAIIGLIALIIASIVDIKKREVPDYVSYSLMVLAIGSSLIHSIAFNDYNIFIHSVMGFIIGVVIGHIMFYTGQWGGGDSKLIMGLGAIFGANIFPIFGENNYWLFIMIGGIIIFGAAYGLLWSIFLAIKNRKTFTKSVKEWSMKKNIIITRRIILIFTLIATLITLFYIPGQFKLLTLGFIAMLFCMFYVWLFVKIIEESCMIKIIPISQLTEGDWIYKDIYIGKGKKKKYITGPKDLGISREQISLLKKYAAKGKIRKITIKEGIPFVPAFLIAYIAAMIAYYSI